MKKLILIAAALSSCLFAGTVMAEEATVISPTEEYVLVDQDGVKITFSGKYDDSSNCANPQVIVENSTDSSIDISYTGTMNGWSIGNCGLGNGSDIKANSKAKAYLWFMFDDYGLTSSDDINTLDLTFSITDHESYSELFTASTGPLAFEGRESTSEAVQGKVLFDQDGVKATMTGETDDSSNCANVIVIVENNTERNIDVSYTGTMNGWNVGNSGMGNASGIKPGSKANGYLWFMFDDYDLTSSDDIETMNLTFTVNDADDYSTLFEVETGEIDFHNLDADTTDAGTTDAETEADADANEEGSAPAEDASAAAEIPAAETEEAAAETAETAAEKQSSWTVMYFLDDFGDEDMDDPYVSQKYMSVGTFTNTATTGSKVYANMIVEDHLVSLFLYEYGKYPVVNSSSYNDDEYEVKFKDADGNVTECFGISYPQTDRIWLVNDTGVTNAKNHTDYFTLDDSSKILALLNKDQKLSVFVKAKSGMSTYNFEIDTTGFKEEFAKAFPDLSAKASSYTDVETIKKVQNALNEAGFNCGTVDGIAGSGTYAALNAYQEANGLPVENLITDDLLAAMGIN